MMGAEAIVTKAELLKRHVVIKERIRKDYRIAELDERLRRERTRAEARLLHKAKLAGVDCPTVLEVDDFSITMTLIDGERPRPETQDARRAGEMLALLHSADIIHGDFTPANLILSGRKLYVIDFGLGFLSKDIEDKAIDVYTMLKALDERCGGAFVEGYCAEYLKLGTGNRTPNPKHKTTADTILRRVEDVKKRVRYAT